MYRLIDLGLKDFKVIRKRKELLKEADQIDDAKRFELVSDHSATQILYKSILRSLPAGTGKIALLGMKSNDRTELLKILSFSEDIRSEIRSLKIGSQDLMKYLSDQIDEKKLCSISFKILSKK